MDGPLPHVQPGDLITSNTFNAFVDLLNSLNTRVTALESATPGNGGVVAITALIPSPPLYAGQSLQILGRNFGFLKGATVLTFDNVQVNAFDPQRPSSDSALNITVPFLSNLPRDVVLSVSNGSTTATQTVHILPMQQPQQGNVDVLWNDNVIPNPNPNPIAPGQAATFAYVLNSRALLPASFAMAVRVDGLALANPAQVLDDQQNVIATNQIDLAPGQQKGFFVRIPAIPAGTTGTIFNLTVSATVGNVAGSDSRGFTIGTAVPPPDNTFTLTVNSLTATDAATNAPDPTSTINAATATIQLKKTSIGRLQFFASFTVIGTYNVTVATVGATTNWVAVLADTPTQYVIAAADIAAGGGTATKDPQIGIQAQAGASATGQIQFTIQRQGSTQNQTRVYNLMSL
jgi:hypothetical protein